MSVTRKRQYIVVIVLLSPLLLSYVLATGATAILYQESILGMEWIGFIGWGLGAGTVLGYWRLSEKGTVEERLTEWARNE